MKISDFMLEYEKFCPKELAVEGDPVGLQVGNPNDELTKVLVTLIFVSKQWQKQKRWV